MGQVVTYVGKWLFLGLVLIVVLALMVGADINTAPWLNPEIANATQKQMDAATQKAIDDAKTEIPVSQAKADLEIAKLVAEKQMVQLKLEQDTAEFQHQAAISDLKRQAELAVEIQRIQDQTDLMKAQMNGRIEDQEHQQAQQALRRQIVTYGIGAVVALSIVLLIALVIVLLAIVKIKVAQLVRRSSSTENQIPLVEPADESNKWHDPEYRHAAIQIARYNEIKVRKSQLAAKPQVDNLGLADEQQIKGKKRTPIYVGKKGKNGKNSPLAV